ncbi:MAG TPA: universal stress protein [Vicinamibacterales bacterium]|jgi:nucleotide-binding universal stress UspA family protein
MTPLRKILVATDFSEPSEAALAYGRELARTFGAKLTLLHIVDDVTAHTFATDGAMLIDAEAQSVADAAAHRRLESSLSEDDRRELQATTALVMSMKPATAIVSYAQESGVDLIVMGTHGRGGVAHFLMGSVAEQVVRTAPAPVLTIRCPGRDLLRPDALVAVAKA